MVPLVPLDTQVYEIPCLLHIFLFLHHFVTYYSLEIINRHWSLCYELKKHQ